MIIIRKLAFNTTTNANADEIIISGVTHGNELLVLPTLFVGFCLILAYCCWRSSLKNRRRGRHEVQLYHTRRISTTEAASITAAPVQLSARSTREIVEQRRRQEIQQRRLPLQAAIRRRERESHQRRLENAAHVEKNHKSISKAMEHRRKILLLKFKHDNMEQTLSEVNFIYTNNADPIEEEENKCTINATIRNSDTTNTNGNKNEDSSIEITAVSIAVSSSASISVNESKRIDHHCLQQSEEFSNKKESQYLIIDRKNNKGDSVTRSSSSTSTTTVPNQCIICLQEYKPNDVIVWSENPLCLHCYHRDCILEYLVPLIDLENNKYASTNDINTTNTNTNEIDTNPTSLSHINDTVLSPSSIPPLSLGRNTNESIAEVPSLLPCPCCRLPFLLNINTHTIKKIKK